MCVYVERDEEGGLAWACNFPRPKSGALKKDVTVRHKQNDNNSEQNDKQMGCGCLSIGTKQTYDTPAKVRVVSCGVEPNSLKVLHRVHACTPTIYTI
jgi:hypothetical protein